MLAALLAFAQITAPVTITPATDAASDARCIVVFGFVGSRGSTEQADSTKRGILYFVGKMIGRDPGVNVAATVVSAADAAKAAGLNAQAEGTRCAAEVQRAGDALRAIGPTAAGRP